VQEESQRAVDLSQKIADGTDFAAELKERCIKRLFIGGLATDYCILNTVLDARTLGYETVVLQKLIASSKSSQK